MAEIIKFPDRNTPPYITPDEALSEASRGSHKHLLILGWDECEGEVNFYCTQYIVPNLNMVLDRIKQAILQEGYEEDEE